MKILLLKSINEIYYVIQPNLGLGYLAAIVQKHGHEVAILHPGKTKMNWDGFREHVKDGQYDLIGIQMFTHEMASVKKHIDIIKRYSPGTTVIVGGAHISAEPESTMAMLNGIDFGFVGEAELGIEHFIKLGKQDYGNPSALEKIPNLVWRHDGKNVANARQANEDLDGLGFPAWELMPPSSYPNTPHKTFCRQVPVAPIIVSRGCPFRCTFCAVKTTTGAHIRYRSVENVIAEVSMLYSDYGVREIQIEDDNFTFTKDYVINFCNKIEKNGLELSFALPSGVRLDSLDSEMLRAMERAGFYSISVGIESGSDRVLKMMKKNLSTEIIREKTNLIKKTTGMELCGNFLIGYPGETESEILQTIAFSKSLPLDKASFNFVIPLPGSELWPLYDRSDKSPAAYKRFFQYQCFDGLSAIPAARLIALHKKGTWEFYSRPKILLRLLKGILTLDQVRLIVKRLVTIFTYTKQIP